MSKVPDPFREARNKDGVLKCPFQGEMVPMILRHEDVRKAAKDWKTFSSDAPFRVPIPSEEEVRSMRQLPIETNPPEHTEYRAIVEPFFQRAKQPDVIAQVEALIAEKLSEALDNLSRQQGNSADGQAPAVSDAKQRVQLAKRRLVVCEGKFRAAKTIAVKIEQACQELQGPLAEIVGHVSVTLPGAAEKLAVLIGHLEQYAEVANQAQDMTATSPTSENGQDSAANPLTSENPK